VPLVSRSGRLARPMGVIVAGAAVLVLLLAANVVGAASGFIIATTIVFFAAALFFLVAAVVFVHSIAPAMLCWRAPAFCDRFDLTDAIDGFRLRE